MFTDDATIVKSVLAAIEPKLDEIKKVVKDSLSEMEESIDSLAGTVEDMEGHITDNAPDVVTTTVNAYIWDYLGDQNQLSTMRLEVPGGWLVMVQHSTYDRTDVHPAPTPVFIADPQHTWKLTKA